MTAAECHIERACGTAIDGRRAARALAAWARRFGLGEADVQVLWCLRTETGGGYDQTALAGELAFSAALVSATVERVRAKGWICQRLGAGDRRRNFWQLTDAGREIVRQILNSAAHLRYEPATDSASAAIDRQRREAAA